MKQPTLLIVLALCLSACIPSVHPFYFEKDLVSDPQLTGEWLPAKADEEGNSWKFEAGAADKSLLVTVKEQAKTGTFIGHLFKLGQEHFLDLVAKDCQFDSKQAEIVAASLIRGHLLCSVTIKEGNLQLAFIDFDRLDQQLKENPSCLAHIRDDQVVLTAGTAELQKFIQKNRKTLFGESREFKKSTESKRSKSEQARPHTR